MILFNAFSKDIYPFWTRGVINLITEMKQLQRRYYVITEMKQLQRRYYVVHGLGDQSVYTPTMRFLSKKIVGLSTHPNAKENERGKLFYCLVLIVSL